MVVVETYFSVQLKPKPSLTISNGVCVVEYNHLAGMEQFHHLFYIKHLRLIYVVIPPLFLLILFNLFAIFMFILNWESFIPPRFGDGQQFFPEEVWLVRFRNINFSESQLAGSRNYPMTLACSCSKCMPREMGSLDPQEARSDHTTPN